ncbi:MAG: HAD family phosphatase [Clostridia bacterium]|nr:HAD family phosphatase [Clostridia bacterium]
MGIFDGTLILSDLDGTLLNSSAEISQGNIDAIKYYMDNGGRFSFATGRNYTSMNYFYDTVPANAPAVTSNGAVIYDFASGNPLEIKPIGELGEQIAAEAIRRFPDIGIEVMMADCIYLLKPDVITDMHIKYTKTSAFDGDFDTIPKPWVHLLITRDPATIHEVYDFISSEYQNRAFAQYSAPYFLEVLIFGANKGTAARRIADLLGIGYDGLYTVGDGQNDVQLLSCTKNAFAPANAHDDIKKLCPNMLPDNNHDPIAALVEHIEKTRKS